MEIEPLLGPCGKLPILIRDDDTNFFTKGSMLQSIYSEAWNKGFKVSLSVIPLQKGTDDKCVPPNFRKTGLLYPITNNESLIKFLRDKHHAGEIEILQHGSSHSVVKSYRGEFGMDTPDVEANLERAISVITEAFGSRPSFFVPPYDDISYKNLKLVKKYGLIPIYGRENVHKFFRSPFIPAFLKKRVAKKLYQKFGKSAYVVPVIVSIHGDNPYDNSSKYKNVDECNDCSVQAAGTEAINTLPVGLPIEKLLSPASFQDSILKILLHASSNRSRISSLCIINHYHQYFDDWDSTITRTNMFNAWQEILRYLAGDTAFDDDNCRYLNFGWKTTFSELCNRVGKIKKTITASKTGSKVTIQSISDSETMDNLSFLIRCGSLEKSYVTENVTLDKESHIITIKEVLPKSKFSIYINN